MNDFLIGVGIAILIVMPIAYYSFRRHMAIGRYADVFTKNGNANFYKGKTGKKPTRVQCKKIYERDDWKCQFPGCRVRVLEGNANKKVEHALGLFAGAKPGNINHRVAYDIGGDDSEENLITTCQTHNLKIKNHVTPWAIAVCRKKGWKINPKGLRVVTSWDEYNK